MKRHVFYLVMRLEIVGGVIIGASIMDMNVYSGCEYVHLSPKIWHFKLLI